MGQFGPENDASSKEFSNNFHNERGQELHENHINGFSEKNLGQLGILGLKMAYLHNSGPALMIFYKNLHNETGQEIHPNGINGFSEKLFI